MYPGTGNRFQRSFSLNQLNTIPAFCRVIRYLFVRCAVYYAFVTPVYRSIYGVFLVISARGPECEIVLRLVACSDAIEIEQNGGFRPGLRWRTGPKRVRGKNMLLRGR